MVEPAPDRLSQWLAALRATIDAAVKQKARWMIGIALAGWDRIGWGRRFSPSEYWMRMRDRRAPLSVLVLAAAYLALIGWGLSGAIDLAAGRPIGSLPLPTALVAFNLALLLWRLALRALFTGAAYGVGEALWSVPRAFVSNFIALLAARRALARYLAMLAGRPTIWEKTAHVFSDLAGGGADRA